MVLWQTNSSKSSIDCLSYLNRTSNLSQNRNKPSKCLRTLTRPTLTPGLTYPRCHSTRRKSKKLSVCSRSASRVPNSLPNSNADLKNSSNSIGTALTTHPSTCQLSIWASKLNKKRNWRMRNSPILRSCAHLHPKTWESEVSQARWMCRSHTIKSSTRSRSQLSRLQMTRPRSLSAKSLSSLQMKERRRVLSNDHRQPAPYPSLAPKT